MRSLVGYGVGLLNSPSREKRELLGGMEDNNILAGESVLTKKEGNELVSRPGNHFGHRHTPFTTDFIGVHGQVSKADVAFAQGFGDELGTGSPKEGVAQVQNLNKNNYHISNHCKSRPSI